VCDEWEDKVVAVVKVFGKMEVVDLMEEDGDEEKGKTEQLY
jgi:hypothetical protein